MKCRLIAAGTRLPDWVNTGFREYQKRLRAPLVLELEEIAIAPCRAGENPQPAMLREGERMLAALGPKDHVVALEISGSAMSTSELSAWLNAKLRQAKPIALLDRRSERSRAGVPRACGGALVAVASHAAPRPRAHTGRRAALSGDELRGRSPIPPGLRAPRPAGRGGPARNEINVPVFSAHGRFRVPRLRLTAPPSAPVTNRRSFSST